SLELIGVANDDPCDAEEQSDREDPERRVADPQPSSEKRPSSQPELRRCVFHECLYLYLSEPVGATKASPVFPVDPLGERFRSHFRLIEQCRRTMLQRIGGASNSGDVHRNVYRPARCDQPGGNWLWTCRDVRILQRQPHGALDTTISRDHPL